MTAAVGTIVVSPRAAAIADEVEAIVRDVFPVRARSPAAICDGIKGRVLRETAASAQAIERAKHFPKLAAIGLSLPLRPSHDTVPTG